jgi:hypothetical protein
LGTRRADAAYTLAAAAADLIAPRALIDLSITVVIDPITELLGEGVHLGVRVITVEAAAQAGALAVTIIVEVDAGALLGRGTDEVTTLAVIIATVTADLTATLVNTWVAVVAVWAEAA